MVAAAADERLSKMSGILPCDDSEDPPLVVSRLPDGATLHFQCLDGKLALWLKVEKTTVPHGTYRADNKTCTGCSSGPHFCGKVVQALTMIDRGLYKLYKALW